MAQENQREAEEEIMRHEETEDWDVAEHIYMATMQQYKYLRQQLQMTEQSFQWLCQRVDSDDEPTTPSVRFENTNKQLLVVIYLLRVNLKSFRFFFSC